MSLLGFFDSNSKSSNKEKNISKPQAQSGVSGAAIIGTGNTITLSDSGAVKGAFKFATAANADAATLATNALKVNQNVIGGALDFADAQNARSQEITQHALDSSLAFGSDALDAQQETENNAFDVVSEALHIGTDASASALKNYTAEVNSLVDKTATNNDARIQKIAQYVLLAAVVIVVAPAVLGRRK